MSRVSPEIWLSEEDLGRVGVPHTLSFRPSSEHRPKQIVELLVDDRPLRVRLPSNWHGESVRVIYEADRNGILQPWRSQGDARWLTCSCASQSAAVLLVLCFFTMLCVIPYVLLPAVGLALLSFVPIVVFATFVQLRFAESVKLLQTVTSFFEAIAWFIPLVGIILIIYFPVGWQDWVSPCADALGDSIDLDCLGKRAIQAYLMTAFLEELLKFICVRRLLWLPFVVDSWALCCYGGAAGLGFAAVENGLYVGGGSLATALLRAGSAVPNHLMYGLLHGALLSRRRFTSGDYGWLSPWLPMLLHGSHNFSIALCQYVNLALGLSCMALVALSAMILLRWAMLDLGPEVNVHELIALKLLDGPACCLCCQGQCGWASDWPAGYVADAQVEDRFELNGLQMRGVGRGTYELMGMGEMCSLAAAEARIHFMAMIDSSDFRLGLSRPDAGGETITLSLEGLSVNEKLVDARSVLVPCTIRCEVDLEAGSVTFSSNTASWTSALAPGSWHLLLELHAGRVRLHLASAEGEKPPFQVASCVGQVVGVLLD